MKFTSDLYEITVTARMPLFSTRNNKKETLMFISELVGLYHDRAQYMRVKSDRYAAAGDDERAALYKSLARSASDRGSEIFAQLDAMGYYDDVKGN